jgi:hypothetical protein
MRDSRRKNRVSRKLIVATKSLTVTSKEANRANSTTDHHGGKRKDEEETTLKTPPPPLAPRITRSALVFLDYRPSIV